jgi:hypothetical protein
MGEMGWWCTAGRLDLITFRIRPSMQQSTSSSKSKSDPPPPENKAPSTGGGCTRRVIQRDSARLGLLLLWTGQVDSDRQCLILCFAATKSEEIRQGRSSASLLRAAALHLPCMHWQWRPSRDQPALQPITALHPDSALAAEHDTARWVSSRWSATIRYLLRGSCSSLACGRRILMIMVALTSSLEWARHWPLPGHIPGQSPVAVIQSSHSSH